eukprot:Hpha_TRINITY_DN7539_c0_g1::TRINITY_DN7539_c0_g1_i1::g.19096::m.19096
MAAERRGFLLLTFVVLLAAVWLWNTAGGSEGGLEGITVAELETLLRNRGVNTEGLTRKVDLLGRLSSSVPRNAEIGGAPKSITAAGEGRSVPNPPVAQWLVEAREVYGSYARLAEGSWKERVWIVPPERRKLVAEKKAEFLVLYRNLLLQGGFKQRDYFVPFNTIGDFETLWHFGMMAPRNATLYEVGTYRGVGSFTIAAAIKAAGNGAHLYCVDLWGGQPKKHHRFNQVMMMVGVENFAEAAGQCSADAAWAVADESLDGVIVDGSHKFDDVATDAKLWWHKLKVGGLMIGHDALWHADNLLPLWDNWDAAALPRAYRQLKSAQEADTYLSSEGEGGTVPTGAQVSIAVGFKPYMAAER